MKISKTLDKIIELALILSLTGMIASVVIQVFTRFLTASAPSWTEEAARIFFVYSVVFGAGLGIRDNAFVYLDYFIEKFNPQVRFNLQVSIRILIIAFGIFLFFSSVKFVLLGLGETSPALELNMAWVFAGLPIFAVLIVLYGISELLNFQKTNRS